jgi:hypothetical protein
MWADVEYHEQSRPCVRSSMRLKSAAALMFVSLAGPPVSEFNAESYDMRTNGWKRVIAMQTTRLAQPLQKGHAKYPFIENIWKNFLKVCTACRFCYFPLKPVYIFLTNKVKKIKASVKKY